MLFDSLQENEGKETQFHHKKQYHRVEGPGFSIAVTTYGNPTYPALLLIHGALQSQLCWRYQCTELAQQFYVIALDLPWHGDSSVVSRNVRSTADVWADSIRTVLVELRLLDRSLAIVCWSFGGSVVRNYLARYGLGKIKALISVASMLPGNALSLPIISEKSGVNFVWEKLSDTEGDLSERIEATEAFVVNLTKKPLDPEERYLTYGYNVRASLATRHLGQSLLADVPDDAAVFLKGITIPVLVIHGQDDALVPIELAQKTADLLPRATRLFYSDCGHSPFLEHSALFNHDIRMFLDSIVDLVEIP